MFLLDASIIPILGIYLAAAYRLVPSIALIVQSVQEIQFNLTSVKNLHNDIKKFKIEDLETSNPNKKIKFNEKIIIKNLTFSYDIENLNNKKNVLENLNFEIKKGNFIGIFGESGSGKSTFIDILIGLHAANKGEILVDGNNIQNNIKSWQNLIGYVPQEIYLADSTISEREPMCVLGRSWICVPSKVTPSRGVDVFTSREYLQRRGTSSMFMLELMVSISLNAVTER